MTAPADQLPPRKPGKTGRLPNDPTAPRLVLTRSHMAAIAAVSSVLPPSPLRIDDLSAVAQLPGAFPMFRNDTLGDCVEAAAGHAIQVVTLLGEGTEVTVTDQTITDLYTVVAGYNPADPSTDRGTVIQQMLDYWRKTGIAGHKIAAFAQLPLHDRALVEAAINVFGIVIVGANMPKSAEMQFAQHQPWDVLPPSEDDPYIGGHCFLAGAYQQVSATDVRPEVVTWGDIQQVTDAWWDKNVDEVWVVITTDWANAAGLTPRGTALTQLGQDFTALTGDPTPFLPAPQTPQEALSAFLPAAQIWLAEAHIFPENRAFAKSLMNYLHGIRAI